jgi:hypothetical protein
VNVKPMSMCTIHSLDKTIIIGAGVDQMFNDTLVGKKKEVRGGNLEEEEFYMRVARCNLVHVTFVQLACKEK